MTDREAFLARVRAALGDRPPTLAAAPEVDESIARLVSAEDDVVELYVARAAEVGLQVRECGTRSLAKCVGGLLGELDARTATVAVVDPAAAKACATATRSIETVEWRGAGSYEPHFDVDVGITDADAGIAETGSLVVTSQADRARGAWIAVPVHVAILRASRIVPDLIDYWRSIEGTTPRDLPASTTLISGPSKTADIEGVLVQGVHGPKHVHVILVR